MRLFVYKCIDMLGIATYAVGTQLNVTWWYLSLFIILIAILPFVFMIYKKFRYLCLSALMLIPLSSTLYFGKVFPCICLGIAFSYENWFDKLGNKKVKINFWAFLSVYLSFI